MRDEGAFVLLITGPAGSGKSAAADAWAARQARPTAHIQLDDVREFVISGYADPRDGWTRETERQHTLARANCADMARRYIAAGISCVIDDAIFPRWPGVDFASWSALLSDTPHFLVVLLPNFTVVAERNAQRDGRRLLAPMLLRTIYDMMTPWGEQRHFPVIETSSLSIAETVAAIERAIQHMRERRASE